MEPIEVCNLCGGKVLYLSHSVVYGKEYSDWPYIYICCECDAYVGVHSGTNIPLGTLADQATRQARKTAHDAFDLLWKGGISNMGRDEAYKWLAKQLEIGEDECHIGMFSVEQCSRVVTVIMNRRN